MVDGGQALGEFFYHYSRMSPADRGHDTTASRIMPGSRLCKAMKIFAETEDPSTEDCVRQLFAQTLSSTGGWSWWVLEVHCQPKKHEDQATPRAKRYAVGRPHFAANDVFGRGTRGYVALEVDENDSVVPGSSLVYLKDVWRIDRPNICLEGEIICSLNEKGIEYTPTLECHGDVRGQVTISQSLWSQYHSNSSKRPLIHRQHYRIVVKEIGSPLEQVPRSFGLVMALTHALIGTLLLEVALSSSILIHTSQLIKLPARQESCIAITALEMSYRVPRTARISVYSATGSYQGQ